MEAPTAATSGRPDQQVLAWVAACSERVAETRHTAQSRQLQTTPHQTHGVCINTNSGLPVALYYPNCLSFRGCPMISCICHMSYAQDFPKFPQFDRSNQPKLPKPHVVVFHGPTCAGVPM